MRRFHKNPQAPTILRQQEAIETQKLIDAVNLGNDSPIISGIYNHPEVKTQLKNDQNGKCAYCERKLNGDYGAVEHYRPKGAWQQCENTPMSRPGYYWLAYRWENLLYSCSECNTSYKRNLFPLENPVARGIVNRDIRNEIPLIINPSCENPGCYISFRREIAIPRLINGEPSLKGRTTIDILGLNKRADLKYARRAAYRDYRTLMKIKAILEKVGMLSGVRLVNKLIQRHTSEYAEFSGMFENQI